MLETYANVPFTYTYNVGLDLNETWNASTTAVTLDYQSLWYNNSTSNEYIGTLTSNLSLSNPNLPNPNNYSLTISASPFQTQQWMDDSLAINERILIIQTIFTSNSANLIHANNLFLKVKQSAI